MATSLDGFIELSNLDQKIKLHLIPILKMCERDRYAVAAIHYTTFKGERGYSLYRKISNGITPMWIRVGISAQEHFVLDIPVCRQNEFPGLEIELNVIAYLRYLGYTELANSIEQNKWHVLHKYKFNELDRVTFENMLRDELKLNSVIYICPCGPHTD